jgi:hypothetical protein
MNLFEVHSFIKRLEIQKSLFYFLFIFFNSYVHAISYYTRPIYKDPRWLGRGNTGVAVITDGSALFYNPAGLGQNQEYNFEVFNPSLGVAANAYESGTSLSTFKGGSSTISDKFSPFLGKPLTVESNLFPNFAIPKFAMGAFFAIDGSAEYRNPVNPELYIKERDDWGFTLGSGFSYEERFFFGASIHYIKRTIIDEEITGATFLNSSISTLTGLTKKGIGVGANLGFQYKQPLSEHHYYSLGISIDDVGSTHFRNKSLTLKEPSYQQQSVNFGSAYTIESEVFDLKVLVDARHLDRSVDYAVGKQIFLGTEVSLLFMDLRAGFYEGYWTAGLTLRFLPLFNLTLTTYAEELDHSPGLRENRVYMLGISSGLHLKALGKKKQKYSLDDY